MVKSATTPARLEAQPRKAAQTQGRAAAEKSPRIARLARESRRLRNRRQAPPFPHGVRLYRRGRRRRAHHAAKYAQAFGEIRLKPRVLVDVSRVDTSVTALRRNRYRTPYCWRLPLITSCPIPTANWPPRAAQARQALPGGEQLRHHGDRSRSQKPHACRYGFSFTSIPIAVSPAI